MAGIQAIWQGTIIAESEATVVVEGNHYFPLADVNADVLQKNEQHSVCPWKGTASYYDIVVDGQVNKGAAWYYPEPKEAAGHIRDHVAFWHGVEIHDSETGGS